MILACPQCKSPVARDGQRYCYRCGNDLSAYYDSISTQTRVLAAEGPGAGAPPASGDAPSSNGGPVAEDRPTGRFGSANDTLAIEPPDITMPDGPPGEEAPPAMLRILLPTGDVFDRELNQREIQMGKGPRNDLVVADPAVSSSHALIRVEGKRYVVSDVGSRNGTYVNGERISEPRVLEHGDIIGIGLSKLTFRLIGQGDTGAIRTTDILVAPAVQPLTEEALARAVINEGLVSSADVERARGNARGRRLYRLLVEEKLAREDTLRDLMSRIFRIEVFSLGGAQVDEGLAAKFPSSLARERLVFPIEERGDKLLLAVADPTDTEAVEEARREMGQAVEVRLATAGEIREQIDRHYAPKLIGVLPSGEKLEYPITQAETEVGKAPHNQIVLTDPTVSNTHAIILARDGGYSIVDLGSRNGTYVNGERLGTHARTLRHGDSIQLGQTVFTFRNPEETAASITAVLSAEALADVRQRSQKRAAEHADAPAPVAVATVDEEEDKAEKKRKKEEKKKREKGERIRAAYIGGISRILAQVFAVMLSVGLALYITNRQTSTPTSRPVVETTGKGTLKAKLTPPPAATPIPGGLFEASSVVQVPNSDGVLFVDDSKAESVMWAKLDEAGQIIMPVVPVSIGARIVNPEGITYGGGYFYMVGSQGDPLRGDENAIARFAFDPATQTIQGTTEVIPNLRNLLLTNVPELRGVADPPALQGGLDIEGIAWDPAHERLLLGLRGPIPNGNAMVVPMKLRDPRGPFTADNLLLPEGPVIRLALGGFGIRDIQYDTYLRAFLIIAGAPNNVQRSEFSLWEWTGSTNMSDPNTELRLETSLDSKMKPEGVTHVRIGTRDFVLVVGDASVYLKLDYLQ